MCKKADDIPLKLCVETEVLDLGTSVSLCLRLVIYCVSAQGSEAGSTSTDVGLRAVQSQSGFLLN